MKIEIDLEQEVGIWGDSIRAMIQHEIQAAIQRELKELIKEQVKKHRTQILQNVDAAIKSAVMPTFVKDPK